jgi:transposase InsO family protein
MPEVNEINSKSLGLDKDLVGFMLWGNRDPNKRRLKRKRHTPNCQHPANAFPKLRCYNDWNLRVEQPMNLVWGNIIPRQGAS